MLFFWSEKLQNDRKAFYNIQKRHFVLFFGSVLKKHEALRLAIDAIGYLATIAQNHNDYFIWCSCHHWLTNISRKINWMSPTNSAPKRLNSANSILKWFLSQHNNSSLNVGETFRVEFTRSLELSITALINSNPDFFVSIIDFRSRDWNKNDHHQKGQSSMDPFSHKP